MLLSRKVRRTIEKSNRRTMRLEQLEPRLMLNADLAVDEFVPDSPGPFSWGDSLTLAADTINLGDVDAGGFDVTIALSDDDVWDGPGTDMQLDMFHVDSLSVGQSHVQDVPITLPTEGPAEGAHLLMVIDQANTVAEDNEANNLGVFVLNMDGGGSPTDPDLEISNFNAGGPFILGDSFEVTNEVHNLTDIPAGTFDVEIFISADPNIDPSDTLLASRTVGGLGADGRDEAHTVVSLPDDGSITAGTYYLGVIADPDNQTMDPFPENNRAGFQIQVQEPEPPIPQVDLQPGDVTWPAETPLDVGVNVDMTGTVSNYGADPADTFTMQIILSENMDFTDGNDFILAEWQVSGLAGGGTGDSRTENVSISVKTLTVQGDVQEMTISLTGQKTMLRAVTINGDVQGLDITAASVKSLNVDGDLLDAIITADSDKSSVGTVSATGDMDITLTVSGSAKSITAGGSLSGEITLTGPKAQATTISAQADITAEISVDKAVKTISAGGSIDSDAITIEGTGKGQLGLLKAGQTIDVANLDVDGMIKAISAGSQNSPGNLFGQIAADTMIKTVQVFGDVYADITAGTRLGTVNASGELAADASLNCEAGDIDKLIFGDMIYGTINANNGSGCVKQIQRSAEAFVNPNTGGTDSYGIANIEADLAKTKWLNL